MILLDKRMFEDKIGVANMDGGGSTSFIGYFVSLQCDNGSVAKKVRF